MLAHWNIDVCVIPQRESVNIAFMSMHVHDGRGVRDILVQILAKAPNLDQMFTMPYYFDFADRQDGRPSGPPFWLNPRWPPSGLAVNLRKHGNNLYTCYLAIKFYKWGIKMTAINSVTHIKSIHTNTELGSKHIRKHMSICFEKNMFSPYDPWSHPTTDFCDLMRFCAKK
jgi:hypothetical protein